MPDPYTSERYKPNVPVCASSKISLRFTGSQLVMTGGSKSYSYKAKSGGSREAPPIPSGGYWINPSELWERDAFKNFGLRLKGVDVESHRRSWGDYRITLHPWPTTDTKKRGGFFIHGGAVPGSAGCIDLTSEMNTFVKDLKAELGGTEDCYINVTVD